MTTPSRRLGRLLALYPLAELQETLGEAGKKQAIIASMERWNLDDAFEFARTRFGSLKQHVYLIRTDLKDRSRISPFSELKPRHVKNGVGGGAFCLLEQTYDVTLADPLDEQKIKFWWPVRTRPLGDGILAIQMAIMAKSVPAYVTVLAGQRIAGTKRSVEETTIVEGVKTSLASRGNTAFVEDINRGIKSLWKTGKIDAPRVEWKRSKSTARELMDKGHFLKRDYPSDYKKIVKKTLLRTSFTVFDEGEPTGWRFVADPDAGQLSFRKYPPQRESIDELGREILRGN